MRVDGVPWILVLALTGGCFEESDPPLPAGSGGPTTEDEGSTGDGPGPTTGEGSEGSEGTEDEGTTTVGPDPLCGNGELDAGEDCDDGNVEPGDGCEADCSLGSGAMLWSHGFDGSGLDDLVTDIAVDGEGNVIVVGHSHVAAGDPDAFIRKYGPDGRSLQWQDDIASAGGEDTYQGVAVDSVGNIVAGGWLDADLYMLVKYAPDGAVLWTQGNDQGRLAHDVEIDAADDILVAGAIYDFGGVYGWRLAGWKYAPDGAPMWQGLQDGPGGSVDVAYGSTLDLEGNQYLVGVHNPPNQARFLRRSAVDGSSQLELSLDFGTTIAAGFDVAVDTDSAVTVAAVGDDDGWLTRIQPDGTITWTFQLDGGVGSDRLDAVIAQADGTVVAAGSRTLNGLDTEAPVIGFDLAGNELWQVAFDGEGTDGVLALTLGPDGYLYAAGHSDGPNGLDAWWAKLQP